tara:strand:- start:493 stop:717 length:225 start_codon:yes stop_codon:yes gene_type:complete
MHTTVKAQGFAWNSTTRTHSDKVIYEAKTRTEVNNWIERKAEQLQNLTILHGNEKYILHQLLQEYGLGEAEVTT